MAPLNFSGVQSIKLKLVNSYEYFHSLPALSKKPIDWNDLKLLKGLQLVSLGTFLIFLALKLTKDQF